MPGGSGFAVVVFNGNANNEVGLVPCKWLVENGMKSYWPPYKESTKVNRAIKLKSEPMDNWRKYSVRVLARYEDYSEARRKAKMAEDYSDLQSEAEYGRGNRRIIKKRHFSDSESDSSVSSSSTVELCKRKNRPPAPIDDVDVPKLKRSNAALSWPKSCPSEISNEAVKNCKNKNSLPPAPIFDMPNLARGNSVVSLPKSWQSEICNEATSSNEASPRYIGPNDAPQKTEDLKLIFRILARIEANLEHVNKRQDQLIGHLERHERESNTCDRFLEVDEHLPLATLEELNQFCKKIELEFPFQQKMFLRLKRLGGVNVKMAVRTCINHSLAHSVQRKLNWEGRIGWRSRDSEGKVGFKAMTLCSLIKHVIMANKNFECSEKEVEDAIKIFLRNSGDRCGGRSRRFKAALNTSDSSETPLNTSSEAKQ